MIERYLIHMLNWVGLVTEYTAIGSMVIKNPK
ncbi:UNVERIFIED_ORG: hypothetical protein FNL38_101271 [Nocardia globerula]|uniref:Uncharacterized protein n=1 Tax=Nocardia globerula TaxID=1818 RepID=A0A652YW64_NOCGL|nr:hypothetical protein SZ00_00169 [Rhodococcus sp. AD45]PVX64210.1 hypothetical protein C8E04_1483 [Rhodococcus globerulus]